MILSDRDIKKYLAEGKLKIEPLESEEQIQGAWVDLRLGNEFKVFITPSTPFIDPKNPSADGYTNTVTLDDEKPLILHPNEFVLGTVREYIRIPEDIMGSVDGRSSLGRLGVVVHSTSAGIAPGWEGNLVLEISNVGKIPVMLYPGMRVCKLVLHKLTSEAELPYYKQKDAKYQKQKTISESKIFKEF